MSGRSKTLCPTCHKMRGRRECVDQMCVTCCRHLANVRSCFVHSSRPSLSSSSIDVDDDDEAADSRVPDEHARDAMDANGTVLERMEDGHASSSTVAARRASTSSAADAHVACAAAAQQTSALSAAGAGPLTVPPLPDSAPPAWAQALLARVEALQAAVDARDSRPPQPQAPQLPPMPQTTASTHSPAAARPAAPQQQPPASEPAPAHLQVFGRTGQVAASAHINQQIINQYSTSRPDSALGAASHFLGHMTGSLAPTRPGQDGPTFEQFVGRNIKDWKAFRSDADFREALADEAEAITLKLARGGLEPDTAMQLTGTIRYFSATRDFVDRYGHSLVFKYHQAALKAAGQSPPWYNPSDNGPVYVLAYSQILQSAVDRTAKRTSHSAPKASSTDKAPAATARADTGNNKRKHTDDQCSLHPSSSHTNSGCKVQNSKHAKKEQ